jgi:hypothetical protein
MDKMPIGVISGSTSPKSQQSDMKNGSKLHVRSPKSLSSRQSSANESSSSLNSVSNKSNSIDGLSRGSSSSGLARQGSASSIHSGIHEVKKGLKPIETAAINSVASKENVQVTVRIRPLSENEQRGGASASWDVNENACRVRHIDPNFGAKRSQLMSNGSSPGSPFDSSEFMYDHVFQGSENVPIYSQSVRTLVYSTMEGYHGTVFAYGQTSSGKTYTMMGNDAEPGIIPQAVSDVFQYIKKSEGMREFLLRVSYLEIYNETIRDLLSPETKDLRIHEDKRRGVYVSPLKEEIVTSPSQVMKVLARGEGLFTIQISRLNLYDFLPHYFIFDSESPCFYDRLQRA